MANIYFPKSSNIIQRTTSGSGYTEIVLNIQPNNVIFFDTSSALISMSADIFNLTSSWSVSSSYVLNSTAGGADILQVQVFM